MDISFANDKLEEICNDSAKMKRMHGPDVAKTLTRRLAELRSAITLADVRKIPGTKCHELKHDRKGELALSLGGAMRLILVPAHEPIPTRPDDNSLDWTAVTAVCIMEVTNYHEA